MRKRKYGKKIAVVLTTAILLSQTAITVYGALGPGAIPVTEEVVGIAPGAEPAADVGEVPRGDTGTTLSPVVTVSDGERQAAEQQSAVEEAARQAATGGRFIDPDKPMVALTFDDGPQPSVGDRIMDCLAQSGGKVTFFVVGDRVASRAAEMRRMVAEGHEVANHTMNHKYLQKLGAVEIQAQVNKCNDAIEAACGVRPAIMRLPGGSYNSTVLANTHMPMIQWSIDTLDWKTRNSQSTIDAVMGNVKDGDIILMHELYSQTGDAALQIIPALTAQGYQLVTVSEMAAAKGIDIQTGKLYSSFR